MLTSDIMNFNYHKRGAPYDMPTFPELKSSSTGLSELAYPHNVSSNAVATLQDYIPEFYAVLGDVVLSTLLFGAF